MHKVTTVDQDSGKVLAVTWLELTTATARTMSEAARQLGQVIEGARDAGHSDVELVEALGLDPCAGASFEALDGFVKAAAR